MDLESRESVINVSKQGNAGIRPIVPGNRFSPSPRMSQLPPAGESKFVSKILDKVIGVSLFMMVFGIPLFFTGFAFQGVIFEKQLYFYFWLLLAIISWAVKGVLKEELDIRRTPLDLPILAFWFVYLLATVFSIDRWHSFWGAFSDPSRGFMSVTSLVITYYLVISNINPKRLKVLLVALIASCSILIIWSSLIFFNVFSLNSVISGKAFAQYIPLSIIGTVKGMGIFLSAMAIILVTAILKVAEDEQLAKIKRNLSLGFLFLILVLDLFLIMNIYGWVTWIGLFLGVVIFLVYILSKVIRLHKDWVWLPMVLFVGVMVIKIMGGASFVKVNLPIEVDPDSISDGGYAISWDIAKQSLKENFLLGSGPATYGYNFSLYRPADFNTTALFGFRFFQGRGLFFEALSTVGGLGTFFLVVLLLSYLSIGFYLISRDRERNKIYSLGFFAASVICLAGVFTEKMDGGIFIFSFLLSILALAAILLESEVSPKYLALSLKSSPKFALALAFVFIVVSTGVAFIFVFLGRIYAADVYAGLAARESYQNLENALPKIVSAANYNNRESNYYSRTGVYLLMLANKEALKPEAERDMQKIGSYLTSSVQASALGADISKNSVDAVEVLAQVYENAGIYVQDSLNMAEEKYNRALELEPHNPNFLLKLGQIRISKATAEKDEAERNRILGEAKDLFQKSIDEKKDFAAGYYQIALVQDALGDSDAAIENATNAVKLTNLENGDYLISLGNMYRLRGKEDDYGFAEEIFALIIKKDENNLNAHFFLGLTYEKKKDWSKAKEEYEKVVSLLPEQGSEDNKKQLEKMISNVSRNRENTPENLGIIDNSSTTETPSVPESNPSNETPSLQDAVQTEDEN